MARAKIKQPNVESEKATTKTARGKKTSLAPDKLVLLVTVVNRAKSDYYLDLIQAFDCNFQLSSFATGTAQQALGLLTPDAEKDVLFSVLTRDKARHALETLERKFKTIRGGNGLAFTIPLTSTIGVLIYRFLSNKE